MENVYCELKDRAAAISAADGPTLGQLLLLILTLLLIFPQNGVALFTPALDSTPAPDPSAE